MEDSQYTSYVFSPDHKESNLYREEYYSSTDTKIFFDGEEQTEIGYIQYEIQEQLKPIYGYTSRTFDDVVIGNRIVTGTFTVPIQNKNLNQIKEKLKGSDELFSIQGTIEDYNNKENENALNIEWNGDTNRNSSYKEETAIDDNIIRQLTVLGFNVSPNSNEIQYKNAIKAFQKKYSLATTGELTSITKNKINEKYQQEIENFETADNLIVYSNFNLTMSKRSLNNKYKILTSTLTPNGTIYAIMDANGNRWYTTGI